MKTNEAPEKIYIDDFGSELSRDWHTEHSYEKDIEYTRTDAIIERAVQFIKEHFQFEDLSWYKDGEPTVKDKAIEDFRNYMKGE